MRVPEPDRELHGQLRLVEDVTSFNATIAVRRRRGSIDLQHATAFNVRSPNASQTPTRSGHSKNCR